MAKKIMSVFLTTLLLAVCFLSAVPVSATTGEYYSEAINTLAVENFSSDDYVSTNSTNQGINIASAYKEGKTTTGSGWVGFWSTTPNSYTAPVDTDKIQHNYVKLYASATATSASTRRFLQVNGMPAGTTAYRLLKETIDFDAEGTVYEFSFDVRDAISTASSRTPFRFKVGDKFQVGYDRNDDKTQVIPVITVGEATKSSSTNLTVSGGTSGEFVTFTVRVEIGADGNDTITLTVQDEQTLQIKNAWAYVSDEKAVVTQTADLTGTASYIGFGSTTEKATKHLIKAINVREIKSCEANADCVTTVNTSIIDGSVAFDKTVSANIDVESKSGNNANIISLAAIKQNDNLVAVVCDDAALATGTTTGTMALSYTFSEENGWDEASFDEDEIGISFFVWNKDSLAPYINKVGFGTEAYD